MPFAPPDPSVAADVTRFNVRRSGAGSHAGRALATVELLRLGAAGARC